TCALPISIVLSAESESNVAASVELRSVHAKLRHAASAIAVIDAAIGRNHRARKSDTLGDCAAAMRSRTRDAMRVVTNASGSYRSCRASSRRRSKNFSSFIEVRQLFA